MNEPKNCPFCGEPATRCEGADLGFDYPLYGCVEPDCPCSEMPFVDLDAWNSRVGEDELLTKIDKAIILLEDEMGEWLPIEPFYMPDHYLQLRQVLDVLRGKEQ